MLFPNVSRAWDGVEIRGQQISILVAPSAEGKLGVRISAEGSLTGFDRACWLTNEGTPYFDPADIAVHDTRLECLAADRLVPFYRSGFIVDIEPGMAKELRAWLPRLAEVTKRAEQATALFARQMGKPIWHLSSEISDVISRIVLDGRTVAESVAFAQIHTVSKEDAEFMAQFDSEAVQAVLHGEPVA